MGKKRSVRVSKDVQSGYVGMQLPNKITNVTGQSHDNALFEWARRLAELLTRSKWSFDSNWNLTDGRHSIQVGGRTPSEIRQAIQAFV